MTLTTATDQAFEDFLAAHQEERLASYMYLIRIPSISALPAHAADCRRTAEWIATDLERIGMEHVEVAETAGHPVVYADWLHAEGAPTVLVYCHYDVQPVDPLDLWTSPPFEPVVVGDRILGRGVADDKGQLHLHLRAAEALLATRGRLAVNLKFVFEGEEESSSVHLDDWLRANRDRLTAEVAVISDTGFFEGNIPAITIALRGMMYAQVDVTGTDVDLHSGGYGGAVQNPANALARIIAGLKDESAFAIVFRLGMIPLFLFSGAFFPIANLSAPLEVLARITPLWHGVDLTRMLTLDTVDGTAALGHVVYLAVLAVLGWFWAVARLTKGMSV